eukprot:COSAG02_NODE_2656_length_8316_cov_8.675672_6_plen_628_part_00
MPEPEPLRHLLRVQSKSEPGPTPGPQPAPDPSEPHAEAPRAERQSPLSSVEPEPEPELVIEPERDGLDSSKGAQTSRDASACLASVDHRAELEQVRNAARALTTRAENARQRALYDRELERKREQQSQLEALLGTRLSITDENDVDIVRPPPPLLPLVVTTERETELPVPQLHEIAWAEQMSDSDNRPHDMDGHVSVVDGAAQRTSDGTLQRTHAASSTQSVADASKTHVRQQGQPEHHDEPEPARQHQDEEHPQPLPQSLPTQLGLHVDGSASQLATCDAAEQPRSASSMVTGRGLQSQLADLVQQSRVYRLASDAEPPHGIASHVDSSVVLQSAKGLSPAARAAELEAAANTKTVESEESSPELRQLAQASLAVTASMSAQLATALRETHELRIELQVASDIRSRMEARMSTAEAAKRALSLELEDVARCLSMAAAQRDVAQQKATAAQAAIDTQQQAHEDQVAVLREEHRRLLVQRAADMEAARRDARSDLLLFGVMQAATAGADLSPDRNSNSQRASSRTDNSAFFSAVRPSTTREARGSGPRSSDESLSSNIERTDDIASRQQVQTENEELRQRLLAADAIIAREKAKGDQWLSMIGSLREELAQAHRRIDALGGDDDRTMM